MTSLSLDIKHIKNDLDRLMEQGNLSEESFNDIYAAWASLNTAIIHESKGQHDTNESHSIDMLVQDIKDHIELLEDVLTDVKDKISQLTELIK